MRVEYLLKDLEELPEILEDEEQVCLSVSVCLSYCKMRVEDLLKNLEEMPEIIEDEEQVCLCMCACLSV